MSKAETIKMLLEKIWEELIYDGQKWTGKNLLGVRNLKVSAVREKTFFTNVNNNFELNENHCCPTSVSSGGWTSCDKEKGQL